MSVYRVCFKIFKKNLPIILIYFIVFIGASTIISFMAIPRQTAEFGAVKINIAFFTDENTPLTEGLKQALSPIANFVELEYESEKLQEALFYRRVHYILRVPRGFTESFLKGEEALLQRTKIPDSASAVYIDMKSERFLTTLYMYHTALPQMDLSEIVGYTLTDLNAETRVDMIAGSAGIINQSPIKYFFNFISYSLMFSIIFGVSSIMLAFNNIDLKRRNLCSPIGVRKINLQCYSACAVFSIVNWAILVILSLIIGMEEAASISSFFYAINALVFTISISGLAFLIASFAKNSEVTNAIANVITLGTSFLSGVFVPQEFLGDNVLLIARFMPTYWYVRANGTIASLADFSFGNLSEVWISMMIQIGFAAVFLIGSIAIAKRRQTSAG